MKGKKNTTDVVAEILAKAIKRLKTKKEWQNASISETVSV
jgi:predicted transcriptional regulator